MSQFKAPREVPTEKMTFKGADDNIEITWHQDYILDVADGVNPLSVSIYDAETAPGIPIVNRSVWSHGGKIMPFVICKQKTAVRHKKRKSRFIVRTAFGTPGGAGRSFDGQSQEEANAPIDPPESLTDITPKATVSYTHKEEVLYQDLSDEQKDCMRTPADSLWSAPVMHDEPILILKVSQYEEDFQYVDGLDRHRATNKGPWLIGAAHQWKIMKVDPKTVEVVLSGGVTEAELVTYTCHLDRSEYGWREARALIDTQYKDDNGDIKKFQSKQPGNEKLGLIDEDGKKRADQNFPPDYIAYERDNNIDFDAFMQLQQ